MDNNVEYSRKGDEKTGKKKPKPVLHGKGKPFPTKAPMLNGKGSPWGKKRRK